MLEAPATFQCDRLRMRLTTTSCAGFWRAAQKLPRDSGRNIVNCKGCPVGAANAGQPIAQSRVAWTEADGGTCIRCWKTGRKMVSGRICVSCYNRQLEVVKGRNRKGSRPRLQLHLHTVSMILVEPSAAHTRRIEKVASGTEAVICAMRETQREAFVLCPGAALL